MENLLGKLITTSSQGHKEQIQLYEQMCEEYDSADIVHALEKWAHISRLIHVDKNTATKDALGTAIREFIALTTQSLDHDVLLPFRNKEGKVIQVNANASFFGVRLTLVKEMFDAFLRHPEVLKVGGGALKSTTLQKLNKIIPIDNHDEYIQCIDSNGITDRFFNAQVSAVNPSFKSGVKCMFSSIKYKGDEAYWIPKQYVGMQWIIANDIFMELLALFIENGFIDKDHYWDGYLYFRRNWSKIGAVKTEDLKPYEDTAL